MRERKRKVKKEGTSRAAAWLKHAGAIIAVLAILACAVAAIAPQVIASSASGTTNAGGFSLASLASSVKMFYGDGELVGQNGTTYSGSMIDGTGAYVDKDGQVGYLSVADETVFAVYSEDDNSLRFYNRAAPTLEVGDLFNGLTVTAIYTGFDTAYYTKFSDVPWYGTCSSIKSVVVEDSFSPINTSFLFSALANCTSMDLAKLDTSNVTNMSYMFYSCTSLTSLDLSSFDTSNVTNMSYMFALCAKLESLDLSNFDTSNVTSMSYMFYYCRSLENLDVSSFDTSIVTSMPYMFYICTSLETLDLTGFDTSSVENMSGMFCNCSSLTTIYVGEKWNTDSVSNSLNMFYKCTSLVGGNGTACDGNTNIDKTYACADTDTTPGYLTLKTRFAVYCETDGSLTFYNNTDEVPEEGGTYNGKEATYVYTGFETTSYRMAGVQDYTYSFGKQTVVNYTTTAYINSNTWWNSIRKDILSVTVADEFCVTREMGAWFCEFTNCTSMDLSKLDISNATSTSGLFYGCSSLTSLDLGDWETGNVTSMECMFAECSDLMSLNLDNFDTSNVTDMSAMFCNCSSLTTIYAGEKWNTDSVSNSSYMFYKCTSLVGGNGTTCDGSTNIDATYARIDTVSTPGYFTGK